MTGKFLFFALSGGFVLSQAIPSYAAGNHQWAGVLSGFALFDALAAVASVRSNAN